MCEDCMKIMGFPSRRMTGNHNSVFKIFTLFSLYSEQFMHNKFAVIDERIVITGSFNWSIGARFKNKENVVITNIPSLAKAYEEEFKRLWVELNEE